MMVMCLAVSPHVWESSLNTWCASLFASCLDGERTVGLREHPGWGWCATSGSLSQQKSISLTSRLRTHTDTHTLPLEAESWQLLLSTDKSHNTAWGCQLSGWSISSATLHVFQLWSHHYYWIWKVLRQTRFFGLLFFRPGFIRVALSLFKQKMKTTPGSDVQGLLARINSWLTDCMLKHKL